MRLLASAFSLVFTSIVLSTMPSMVAAAVASARPNIVILYADDSRATGISRFKTRAPKIPTPHLDQLAREGYAFHGCP